MKVTQARNVVDIRHGKQRDSRWMVRQVTKLLTEPHRLHRCIVILPDENSIITSVSNSETLAALTRSEHGIIEYGKPDK